jgi:hypothetical protein
VIPEGFHELLESTIVAHVATIGSRGEPQNNLVWFGWDGEYAKFSQTKTRQKLPTWAATRAWPSPYWIRRTTSGTWK